MENEKIRADVALVKRGYAQSRERAQSAISAGLVLLNGKPLTKASVKVDTFDNLEVLGTAHPYVSRGGLKLEKALKSFHFDPAGKVAMDIGASTGGFTDVLLQNGARHIYAIDVGFGQLDAKLSADSRVTSMEHTNARTLTADMFPLKPDFAVMDVSFISITLILPCVFAILGEKGRMLSLVKPQFEAGKSLIGKNGVVKKPAVHRDILKSIVEFAPGLGWRVRALDFSPIVGGDGNIEFLADFIPASKCDSSPTEAEIDKLVRQAHDAAINRR